MHPDPELPDAIALRPPSNAGIWALMPYKLALVKQHGIDDGFRIYREVLNLPATYAIRSKPTARLRDFAIEHGVAFHEVWAAGEPFAIEPPKILGANDSRTLRGLARSFYVACLPDVVVDSYSSILFAGDSALIDRESGEGHLPQDYLEVDPRVFAATSEHIWAIDIDEPPIDVDEAYGSLVGPNATHFGHWLHEYFPKYAAAVRSGALPAVPILINPWAHVELRGALERLLPGVETIEVTPYRPVRVRRLWVTPALVYTPLLEKVEEVRQTSDYLCVPPARFAPALAEYQAAAARTAPDSTHRDRLYLSRAPQLTRKLCNREAIETIALSRGFTVVRPETLSFEEQVRVVRRARYVVGPEGSSMYLNFFARPGTKLCVLNPPLTFDPMTYAYLLREIGIDVTVFTGPALRLNNANAYPHFGNSSAIDYEIDEGGFAAFLDDWLA